MEYLHQELLTKIVDESNTYAMQCKPDVPLRLTHLFPMHPLSNPENIRKSYGFLMFSGGRERMHWEQMG